MEGEVEGEGEGEVGGVRSSLSPQRTGGTDFFSSSCDLASPLSSLNSDSLLAASSRRKQPPLTPHPTERSTDIRDHSPLDNARNEESVLDPKIGMEFETEEDAYTYYNNYAKRLGFSIRRGWINKRTDGTIARRNFFCYKEGERLKDKREVKHHRDETRTNCKAFLKVALQPNGKYSICKFEAAHNHVLEPPTTIHLLRSHRKGSTTQAQCDDGANHASKRPIATFELMLEQTGGHENGNCTESNFKNYLQCKRQKAMQKFDAGCILEYFQKKQIEDPSFYYAIQLDEDDQITNIFWADTRMRMDYERFGDVVCFDTTYKINNYGRPFAPFIGVNNHKQSIVFGASLLYDETINSFEWLFRTFHDAMQGKMPQTILTDESAAMANALSKELPNTAHRVCVWHVYQNAKKLLSNVFTATNTFKAAFEKCIFDYDEESEFLQAWDNLLNEYGLHDNMWLKYLYEAREIWALPYQRSAFCADMKSIQQKDNMNGEIKKFLNIKHNMLQFFEQFERLVDEKRFAELRANFRMRQSTPKLTISSAVLEQARSIYTPVIFEMFQEECFGMWDLRTESTNEVGTLTFYKISYISKSQAYIVTFNSTDDTVACSCKKFEFVGILCKHALCILYTRSVLLIPSKYILKRWTRGASKVPLKSSISVCATENDDRKSTSRRFSHLMSDLVKMASVAAESEELYQVFAMKVHEAWLDIEKVQIPTMLHEPQDK